MKNEPDLEHLDKPYILLNISSELEEKKESDGGFKISKFGLLASTCFHKAQTKFAKP